ncbi:head-tail adaptor protein [Vibrio vulnificus]|uniref:head-tail adaptor protein n=1 Tax=Vibrio vulnificus TaxID=672 RepID=UPI0032421C67
MRTGLMKHKIEVWKTVKTINEYGVYEEEKSLFLSCYAAVKHINNEVAGDKTKSILKRVDFTIRYNRYFGSPDSTMYVKWDGQEYDVINDDNYYSLNKYITLNTTKRSK